MEAVVGIKEDRIKGNAFYIDTNSIGAEETLSEIIYTLICRCDIKYDEIIIVCIGTDRATGDSLGPLIGSKMGDSKTFRGVKLYGSLDEPVHARNIEATIAKIRNNHLNPLIIAVDASLGKTSNIGYIKVGKGCIKPGAGLNKELPPIGDFFVTGIVNFSGMMEAMVLQTTKLSVVMKMAETISKGLQGCLNKLQL